MAHTIWEFDEMIIPRTVTELINLLVITILFYSSFIHLDNNYYFLISVLSYDISSPLISILAASFLPVLQISLACMLLISDSQRKKHVLYAISSLFLIFFLVQLSALSRGLKISCGCFGSYNQSVITMQSSLLPFLLAVLAMVNSIVIGQLSKSQSP